MSEQQKRELILSVFNFYMIFQKEFLDLMPDNNSELSPLLYKMLNEIHLAGSITSSALSKRVSVSIPNTSRSINSLEKLGYIVKTQDILDKRVIHLSLSEKGLDLIRKSLQALDEVFFKKLEALSSEEMEQLRQAFDTCRSLILKIRNDSSKVADK